MTGRKRNAIVGLLFTLGIVAFASSGAWRTFSSSSHFSVAYPETWFRIGISADRLEILSSKGGAEGFVIKRGQAEIAAMEAPGSPTKSLAQVIDYYVQGSSVLSQRNILDGVAKQGCSALTEVTSREAAVPIEDSPIKVPYIINTGFFCEVGGRKIVILVRNFEDDKRQQEYQQVASQMARSIRLTK